MGELLTIPLRNIIILVRWEVASFDGEYVTLRAVIGSMTLTAEIPADSWLDNGGDPNFTGSIETAVV